MRHGTFRRYHSCTIFNNAKENVEISLGRSSVVFLIQDNYSWQSAAVLLVEQELTPEL